MKSKFDWMFRLYLLFTRHWAPQNILNFAYSFPILVHQNRNLLMLDFSIFPSTVTQTVMFPFDMVSFHFVTGFGWFWGVVEDFFDFPFFDFLLFFGHFCFGQSLFWTLWGRMEDIFFVLEFLIFFALEKNPILSISLRISCNFRCFKFRPFIPNISIFFHFNC